MRWRRRVYHLNSARMRAGWILAGLLLVAGVVRSTPPAGAAPVVAHAEAVTVTASSLQPGPKQTLISHLQVRTSSPDSDQLDAALAAGGEAVGVYHSRVSVGEIPDLASCDSQTPPPGVVDQWLHYGPLVVPGRTGDAVPAIATLTLTATGAMTTGASVPITLYFAHAGSVIIDLPLERR